MARVVAADEVVGELAGVIDRLCALDLHQLSDDELSRLVVALEGERSRFEAVRARVTGAFDRRGRWALDQARSAAAWIAHRWLLIRVARESER